MSNSAATAIGSVISKALDSVPAEVWRFDIAPGLTVDMLRYTDRPYVGVDCILTIGVSLGVPDSTIEYVMVFDPATVPPGEDLFALIAAYLQLHHMPHHDEIGIGSYLNTSEPLIADRDFVGLYLSAPVYFHESIFSALPEIDFLWLIPIFGSEYTFIDLFGADAFESCLATVDPDLSQYDRAPIPCVPPQ